MENQDLPNEQVESSNEGVQDEVVLIPTLDLTYTKEAEERYPETKTVNPVTYTDLYYTYNHSYRELKRAHAELGHRVGKAEKMIDERKGELLIDHYPEFLAKFPKQKDNGELRSAFMSKDLKLSKLLDDRNTLKAMEELVGAKIKFVERTCSFMDKQIQIHLKSGIDPKLYVTLK